MTVFLIIIVCGVLGGLIGRCLALFALIMWDDYIFDFLDNTLGRVIFRD